MVVTFETPDHEILEYAYNKAGKQTLVFLPALGFDITYWNKNIPYFNRKNYSTLVITLRGHTQTKTALKNITMQHHIQDLHVLLSHLNIKKPILVGASLGGSVAAAYFQRYKHEVTKCICINTPFSIDDIRSYIRWFVELGKPLVYLDRFSRKSTRDFSKSRFTHNILLSLQYIRQFHILGFYLNYLCVKYMGVLSRKGIVVIDSKHDEVLEKRDGADYMLHTNHAAAISKAEEVNELIEKIITV